MYFTYFIQCKFYTIRCLILYNLEVKGSDFIQIFLIRCPCFLPNFFQYKWFQLSFIPVRKLWSSDWGAGPTLGPIIGGARHTFWPLLLIKGPIFGFCDNDKSQFGFVVCRIVIWYRLKKLSVNDREFCVECISNLSILGQRGERKYHSLDVRITEYKLWLRSKVDLDIQIIFFVFSARRMGPTVGWVPHGFLCCLNTYIFSKKILLYVYRFWIPFLGTKWISKLLVWKSLCENMMSRLKASTEIAFPPSMSCLLPKITYSFVETGTHARKSLWKRISYKKV